MNAQLATSTLDFRPSALDSPSPNQDTEPETQDCPAPLHRKIASLPKAFRDQISVMLDDALPAREIITRLNASSDPVLPYSISEVNISDWRKTGYLEYLRQQLWRSELQSIRESGCEVTELNDGDRFQEILVQLGLTEIFRTLKNGPLTPDSPNYIRRLSAFAS